MSAREQTCEIKLRQLVRLTRLAPGAIDPRLLERCITALYRDCSELGGEHVARRVMAKYRRELQQR